MKKKEEKDQKKKINLYNQPEKEGKANKLMKLEEVQGK